MSIAEVIARLEEYATGVAIFLIVLPIVAYFYGKIAAAGALRPPHRYVFSTIIYLAAVPGIFSAVITAYSLFFLQTNLLEVNFVIYFLPLISMLITVAVIKKQVDLDRLPGFDRLKGLVILLTLTFVILLFLIRFRVWLIFGGSLTALLVLGVGIFLLLRWSAGRMLGRRKLF